MNKPAENQSESSANSGRKQSVRTQLIVWNIIALALLLGVLGGVVHYTVLSFLMDSVNRELDRRVQQVANMPEPPPGPPPGEFRRDNPPFMNENNLDRTKDNTPFLNGNNPNQMRHSPPILNDRFPGSGRDYPPFMNENIPGPDRHGGRPPDERQTPPGFRTLDPYHPHHYDMNGQSRDPFDSRAPWDINACMLAEQGLDISSNVVENGESLQILTRPLRDYGRVIGVVQGAYPLTEINRAISGLNRALLMLIPVGLLGAGMGGAFLTDRVLRRVRRLTQAAGHISALKFSDRLPVSGNDEFSELASTFNGLLGRLETAYTRQEQALEQQRRFTADASHELKTPLTIIKGTTSMILNSQPDEEEYRLSLQEIDSAASTMSTLVQDLLLLARSDEGVSSIRHIELLLKEIISAAVKGVGHIQGAKIKINISDDTLCILGNETELVRLFTNLLDNALRYTSVEGNISVAAARKGDFAVVLIKDTGIGMEVQHLPHLGERFYRVDSSRTRPTGGTGLGLSICKNIVQNHHGSINFESKPGQGTTVSVSLPVSV